MAPRISRRTLLAASIVAVAGCRTDRGDRPLDPPTPTEPREALRLEAIDRGISFLLSRQSVDGRFASTTYGFLAEGRSITPFVALALRGAGAPDEAIGRAADACIALRGPDDGASGFGTGVPDYPVYATALTARLLRAVRPAEAAPSLAWLRTQQFREAEWTGTPAAGGFGMGSRIPLAPPQSGHVDLSMTRRAIEALAAPEWEGADEARAFVLRCRCLDGGFIYSPVQPGLNKGAGGPDRSYGTATCDGILALLALGEPSGSDIVADAVGRLEAIHRPDRNPGLEGGPMDAFATAMAGYYQAASAKVFAAVGGPPGWRDDLTTAVAAGQRPDGSWANASTLQKEDDPLIATAFALAALSAGS